MHFGQIFSNFTNFFLNFVKYNGIACLQIVLFTRIFKHWMEAGRKKLIEAGLKKTRVSGRIGRHLLPKRDRNRRLGRIDRGKEQTRQENESGRCPLAQGQEDESSW
jgi:hypothetical protein